MGSSNGKRKQEANNNPGLMRDLNFRSSKLFPGCFDGLQVITNKVLSPHLEAKHTISLSSITPGIYRFGSTYTDNTDINPKSVSSVFSGDIDPQGNMNFRMQHLLWSRLKFECDGQMMAGDFKRSQLATHYFGNESSASVMLLNPDIIRGSGIIMLQFLQNITSHLTLGAEYVIPVKSLELSDKQFSVCARYNTGSNCLSTVVSASNILLCYYYQASQQLSFGMDLNSNVRTNQSFGSIACQVDLKDRGITFRSTIDSNFNVGSLIEKKIDSSPFLVSVSANLNHRTNNFRLGLGFKV